MYLNFNACARDHVDWIAGCVNPTSWLIGRGTCVLGSDRDRDRFELLQDPNWLDLMPISALGLGTHALPHVGSGKKNEVAVMVISFVPQIMLPKVSHLI